jgi:hypothetical protein
MGEQVTLGVTGSPDQIAVLRREAVKAGLTLSLTTVDEPRGPAGPITVLLTGTAADVGQLLVLAVGAGIPCKIEILREGPVEDAPDPPMAPTSEGVGPDGPV